jgi:hypothetical protein
MEHRGDGAHARPGVLVVHNSKEVPAQFDHGRQLAAREIGFVDGCRGRFIDNEHCANKIVRIEARQNTDEPEQASHRLRTYSLRRPIENAAEGVSRLTAMAPGSG